LNVRSRKQLFAIATALLGLSATLFSPSVDAAPGLPLVQVLKQRVAELPSDTVPLKSLGFGAAVAVRDDVALVGMPGVPGFRNGLVYAYQRVGNEVTLLGVDEHLKGRFFPPIKYLSLSNYVLMAGIAFGIPEPSPFDRVYVYNIRQPLQ
jgi:hypothetical protein